MSKQFKQDGICILQKQGHGWEVWAVANNAHHADVITEAMNLLYEEVNTLREENRELKNENMEYYRLVNCGNCQYHNYDWHDDGEEFEVCDKGNTERLIYNKFCNEWRKL